MGIDWLDMLTATFMGAATKDPLAWRKFKETQAERESQKKSREITDLYNQERLDESRRERKWGEQEATAPKVTTVEIPSGGIGMLPSGEIPQVDFPTTTRKEDRITQVPLGTTWKAFKDLPAAFQSELLKKISGTKEGKLQAFNPEHDIYEDGTLKKPGTPKPTKPEFKQFGNKVYSVSDKGEMTEVMDVPKGGTLRNTEKGFGFFHEATGDQPARFEPMGIGGPAKKEKQKDTQAQESKARQRISSIEVQKANLKTSGVTSGILDAITDPNTKALVEGFMKRRLTQDDYKIVEKALDEEIDYLKRTYIPPIPGIPVGSVLIPQKSKSGDPVYRSPSGELFEVSSGSSPPPLKDIGLASSRKEGAKTQPPSPLVDIGLASRHSKPESEKLLVPNPKQTGATTPLGPDAYIKALEITRAAILKNPEDKAAIVKLFEEQTGRKYPF